MLAAAGCLRILAAGQVGHESKMGSGFENFGTPITDLRDRCVTEPLMPEKTLSVSKKTVQAEVLHSSRR
jgi:hypothetical protein